MLNGHALRTAARGVADKIAPIETSIDTTLAQTAGFLAYLPQARLDANLPASVGHKAIRHVLASINSIVDARTEFLAAHEEFLTARDELRIPETGVGSLGGCPPLATLSVVQSDAA